MSGARLTRAGATCNNAPASFLLAPPSLNPRFPAPGNARSPPRFALISLVRPSRCARSQRITARRRTEHYRDLSASALRAAHPLRQFNQRKISPSRCHQRSYVQIKAIGAPLLVLQPFAAIIEAAHRDAPAPIPRPTQGLRAPQVLGLFARPEPLDVFQAGILALVRTVAGK
jgi:hypothetical protein